MSLTGQAQTGAIPALKRVVSVAACAGLLAGLLLTLAQSFAVNDLIWQAEVYEAKASVSAQPRAQPHGAPLHDHAAGEATQPHQHAAPDAVAVADAVTDASPSPSGRGRRIFLTAVANMSLATGFGLLLCAAIHLRGGVKGWRAGVLWGLAGYLVFFVAPSLGLPPELPGTEALPLAARQQWWLETVVSSAVGLSLLRFAPRWYVKLAGVALLLLPHWLGAPHLRDAASAAPVELANAFVGATAMANAVMWLALGALSGLFYRKAFAAQGLHCQDGFSARHDAAD